MAAPPLTKEEIKKFQSTIYTYYHTEGRKLPWRETRNPYKILISEIMLQQTQVHRVIGKYTLFIKHYPDFRSLDAAPLPVILSLWQGLGYNRRAIMLKKLAHEICLTYNGTLPQQMSHLLKLPGIGKATAASLLAFAFNKPEVVIETNIRAVYIHFFFNSRDNVKDTELYPYIECTVDKVHPRKWYYGLMDYGVFLKKKYPGLTGKSAHYKKQSPFTDSNRQIRGLVLKILTKRGRIIENVLLADIKKDPCRVKKILNALAAEGFLEIKNNYYTLRR